MQDKRLVTRLQNYWDLIRRGKPMPEIQQLNPSTIEDMWQQCMNLGIFPGQGGMVFNCVFMGEQMVATYGTDITGQVMNLAATEYPMNIIVKKISEVPRDKQFVIDENQFINNRGRVVKYRACFMPFGNEAKGVTHVVVGFSGREF